MISWMAEAIHRAGRVPAKPRRSLNSPPIPGGRKRPFAELEEQFALAKLKIIFPINAAFILALALLTFLGWLANRNMREAATAHTLGDTPTR